MTHDFPRDLPTADERLDAAYCALCAFDGRVPTADALALLAGVSVEAAGAWLAERR